MTKSFWLAHSNRILIWTVLLAAILFAALYFLTAIPRLLYPYDLDFVEDGILMTALRLANHQPIFIPPQADFVPHVYMPLYPWLGGFLLKVFGSGFLALRLLSLGATILSGGLIYRIARRESGQDWVGLVSAGLFLGGYQINGFSYELGRVDTLFVALTLAGLARGSYAGSNRALIEAAILLALAFWTKQTALIAGLGLGGYLLLTIGRRAWLFGLTFAALTLMPVAILHIQTEGWFLYYTFHIASLNPVTFERLLNFVGGELLGLMAALMAMAVGAVFLTVRQTGWIGIWKQPWFIWIGIGIFISGMGRASVGGNLNNRMMAYTLLCLAPALLVEGSNSFFGYKKSRPVWPTAMISILILVQFVWGAYNPWRYIPTPAIHQSGDRLIEKIAAVDGEVLVMMHPSYAWLAGKRPSAQVAAMWHARERGTQPLPPDFTDRMKTQYYRAIFSDQTLFETEPALQRLLDTYYQPLESLGPVQVPGTNTGLATQPVLIYGPKP